MSKLHQKKRLYMDSADAKVFEEKWYLNYKRKDHMEVIEVNKGIVIPQLPATNAFNLPDVETGVLDENGIYIKNSGMRNFFINDLSIPSKIKYCDEEVIWGGLIIFHYGHFILQTITRLYYFLNNKNYKIVFVSDKKVLPEFMLDFFSFIGLDLSKIILVNEFTRFKKIFCPPVSSIYYGDYTDDFLDIFDKCSYKIQPANYQKIFLSRKHWKGVAKCYGEIELEKIFNLNGFKSIYLEKLKLADQISIIKGAKVIAGVNGTSFHNILFSNEPKQLIILNRNEEFDSQYILNNARKADWFVVKVHSNPLPVAHPTGPFIIGVNKFFKDFSKDYGLKFVGKLTDPKKYLKKFMDDYIHIYSNQHYYGELKSRKKDIISSFMLINILNNFGGIKIKVIIYYLFYKFTFGKLRLLNKSKFNYYKKNIQNIQFNF